MNLKSLFGTTLSWPAANSSMGTGSWARPDRLNARRGLPSSMRVVLTSREKCDAVAFWFAHFRKETSKREERAPHRRCGRKPCDPIRAESILSDVASLIARVVDFALTL